MLLGLDFSGGVRAAFKSMDSYSPLGGKTLLGTLLNAV